MFYPATCITLANQANYPNYYSLESRLIFWMLGGGGRNREPGTYCLHLHQNFQKSWQLSIYLSVNMNLEKL